MLNIDPLGKIHVSKGKPIKTVNYPFLVFFPNLLFLPEFGWGSYCMGMGRVWEKIWIGQSTQFWKKCYDFIGKKTLKNVCPFPHAFTFSSSLTFWGAARRFWSSILHSHGALMQLNLHGFLSFTFSVFPHDACPFHRLALTKTLWSILIILYSILFMHVVCSSCL